MPDMRRRIFLALPLGLAAWTARAEVGYPDVVSGAALRFPRDHGSHPEFRTEWWYITGLVRDGAGTEIGVQITFFRSRPGIAETGASRFAPRQLLFAHAALARPATGHLLHDQISARTGFRLAEAREDTTNVHIEGWSLQLDGNTYVADIAAREFALRLSFAVTAPPLLQGDAGVSRKGPRVEQASYYYSLPQMKVAGTISEGPHTEAVSGIAWLDHEWSSAYLASEARGWDWTGINLDDGSALMAFRIRDRDGNAFWAGGSHRDANGKVSSFGPNDVRFVPLRRWRSPRTNIEYPVAMRLEIGSRAFEPHTFDLAPLMDDQELDARASVGTVYWEGGVRAMQGAATIGRGYLELTGYGAPLKL